MYKNRVKICAQKKWIRVKRRKRRSEREGDKERERERTRNKVAWIKQKAAKKNIHKMREFIKQQQTIIV